MPPPTQPRLNQNAEILTTTREAVARNLLPNATRGQAERTDGRRTCHDA